MSVELKEVYEVLGPLINVAAVFITLKIKHDIAEVKVWILENFERRRADHK